MHYINIDPSTEIRKEHVCYFTKKNYWDYNLQLYEVCWVYYQHPDGPVEVPVLESRAVSGTVTKLDHHDRPDVQALYLAEKSVEQVQKLLDSKD